MKKTMLLVFSLLYLISLTGCGAKYTSPGKRAVNLFDFDWKFHKGDVAGAAEVGFDDRAWSSVDLPHDWSIAGPFNKNNPSGSGGGYLPGGIGWYRKTFSMPASDEGKSVRIQFDGVYMNSEVWINGHYLGKRPYGYSSFQYELSPYLEYGMGENILAVRVDNSQQPNSRWYSGSGIYRHVWLTVTDQVHVGQWGTYVTTPEASREKASVRIETLVQNDTRTLKEVTLTTTLVDSKGRIIASDDKSFEIQNAEMHEFTQQLQVDNPHLWSTEDPYLYTVYSEVKDAGRMVDNYQTPVGIRTFRFDPDKGFFLNGDPLKMQGVCLHHDLGPLGAAAYDRAIKRQLEIMKSMGCNAIRTSHNPPAPQLLDYADRMGFLVMDEAFDEWKRPKRPYGYHLYFDDWALTDLQDLVRRDRNHPSVILWSAGNEIPEQRDTSGTSILKTLVERFHQLDPTRPVTSGLNHPEGADASGFADQLDVVGINYHLGVYEQEHQKYPQRKLVASETASALETRGIYHMPADSLIYRTPDMYCSSYDNCWVPWGSSAEAAWRASAENDYIAGEFVWTGIDYIGEPTPYPWPARSSYFGIVDLAGFPKDAYYLYQSQWTDQTVLHLLPHWNWEDRAGQTIPVWAYTSCDSVELSLNGTSLGVKHFTSPSQYHVAWQVPYTPGTLSAVGWKDGKQVAQAQVRTAGPGTQIQLQPDRATLHADGEDLSFLTVRILDGDGTLVPRADNEVTFDVEGPGKIVAVGSGDQLSHEDFTANHRRAFSGMCLTVIRAGRQSGNIRVTATSPGLQTASVTLKTE